MNTGNKKLLSTPKPVEALKKDVQGLAILAENVSLNEGFKNPVTKLPMSIAESNTDFQGASSHSNAYKSRSQNSTLNTANTNNVYVCPKSAVWIYDVGKSLINS